MKFALTLILIGSAFASFAQQIDLKEIMKGNDFIGYSPEEIRWSVDGKEIYFQWNPKMQLKTTPHSYSLATKKISEVSYANQEYKMLPAISYEEKKFGNHYFSDNGNLACYDFKTGTVKQIYSNQEKVYNIQRSADGKLVFFQTGIQVYCYDQTSGTLNQLTNFTQGSKPSFSNDTTYLQKQQRELFPYIQLQDAKKKWDQEHQLKRKFPKPIYFGKDENINDAVVSFNGQFVAFIARTNADEKGTNYEAVITENGYTQWKNARSKVDDKDPSDRMGIYNVKLDSAIWISFSNMTDIRKKPQYLKEYGDQSELYEKDRNLCIHAPIINEANQTAIVDIRTYDNKDRWIVLVNLETGAVTELEHQHDEAWIGGPGISGWNEATGTLGWLNTNEIYFQSEETGYSHLYKLNIQSKAKTALTSGKWEVYETILSKDKKSIYFIANKIHPGTRNGYQLELASNKIIPILEGNFGIEWSLSPDGKTWAVRYSTALEPWELYTAPNQPNAKLSKVTTSTTTQYQSLKLLQPVIVNIPTSDGKKAYARLYEPAKANGAAVLFVHGAGYLQNAHYYWSNYYREMLFHQKLVSEGYTVLDVDYRASEGYGRDWRTDIYRHMGERDLKDYIDAKNFLVEKFGIDNNRVGIYGGSYGGFITLMGLLKTPETFACGAALRSVTDWAHYNHEYTSNILNYPGTDPKAYEQSSPIYFAEGLKKPLIMLHGMVDDNVQFQDIVRLNQRFIELGKTNYTLSVFPTEAHGFTYSPAWYDEYRRIYELFNENLLKH
jgi:dipeptidyl aminopeptidase/acylaminoacyl peptidase